MSPLATYRHLFSLTGHVYVVVAFLGRLPLAMSQLGTLLLVAGSTGSYGAGGASAGALAVANAISAPAAGALADRVGQRRVVLMQSLFGGAALALLVALASAGVSWPVQAASAALAGLLIPQVGPLARVRWRPVTAVGPAADHRRLVDAAFSYEGAADEASFVLGPALVGASVAVADPRAALLLAAGLLAVFGSLFALDPTADLTHQAAHLNLAPIGKLLSAGLVLLAVAQFTIGIVFGSAQTGTSVLATAAGEPGMTGLLHALLGVGSVVAGLAITMLPPSFSLERRLQAFALALFVLALPLLLVGSLTALALALMLLGFAIAPYMISVFTLGERITPQRRTGAAMSVLAAVTGLGYATGSTIAGRLADWNGYTPAFAVTVSAGLLAVVLATLAVPTLRRAQSTIARPAEAAASPGEIPT